MRELFPEFMKNHAVTAEEGTRRPPSQSAGLVRRVLLAAIVLVLAWGMIYYYYGVLGPIRARQSQFSDGAQGNWSDLYPRWLGARELLWRHRNPYSVEVTRDIQRGFYGRPIESSNRSDPTDPEAFAYPVYVVFVIAPLLPFPFAAVSRVFISAMFLMTVASVPLWMRGLRLSLQPWVAWLALIATMSSYATIDGLHLEQLTMLVGFLVSASIAALARGRLALAGALLALATIKPQLLVFVVAFVLLWAVREWPSRKRFVGGFGGAMAVLLAGSEIVLPGWFQFWQGAAQEYIHYHRPSLLASMLGQRLSVLVAVGGILICARVFWRASREPVGSTRFNIALISALVLTELVVPNAGGGAFYNHVLLIPVALWLFTTGGALVGKRSLAYLPRLIASGALAGQWVLALSVSFAAFVLRHSFQRESTWFVGGPEILSYVFPLALALWLASAAPESWRRRYDAR